MATLKYVSRMTPCKFGSECDDLKCIYGHRCPNDVEGMYPVSFNLTFFEKFPIIAVRVLTWGHNVGKKDCRWGENCRFERELHGLDRAVVKTLKVGK